MKADATILNKIFFGTCKYIVPYYQRAYVWEEKQWKRFLEDMEYISATKKQHYVDIRCYNLAEPCGMPLLSVKELEAAIPEINWRKGHSGELLTPNQADALDELMRNI